MKVGVGGTVLEAKAYCVPLSASWELKPPFCFLQTLSLYFFIRLWWAEKAKILVSDNFWRRNLENLRLTDKIQKR